MPYKLDDSGLCVVYADTGKPVEGGCHDTKEEAEAHLEALRINVKKEVVVGDTFHRILPLYKVVEEADGTCTVYARGCAEEPDVTDQIMDYATTVPNIKRWSDDVYKRSGGKSYGNIRAMHQAQAAGKIVEPISYNDDEKAVDLVMKVVDPNDAAKCKEGVYTGISIGGHYAKIWRDPKNPRLQRYTGVPKEFSLVDLPAIPSATFQMVKLDGTIEERTWEGRVLQRTAVGVDSNGVDVLNDKRPAGSLANDTLNIAPDANSVSADPIVSEPNPIAGPLVTVGGEPVAPNPMAHGVQILDNPETLPAISKFNELVTKLLESELERRKQEETAHEMLKSAGTRYGIAHRGDTCEPPAGYPTSLDAYGDPANYAYRYDGPVEARVAVSEFNFKKWLGKYDPREVHILGRRIATRAATVLGGKYIYNPVDRRIEKVEVKVNKVDPVAGVANGLREVAQAALEHVNDPQQVMSALHQILAALDVSTDISGGVSGPTANPSTVSVPPQEKAASMSTPSGTYEKDGVTATVPYVSAQKAAETPAASSTPPAATGAHESAASTGSTAEKAATEASTVEKMIDAKLAPVLAELAAIAKALQPQPGMSKGLPLMNLNPVSNEAPSPEQSPLEKAIVSSAKSFGEGLQPDHFQHVMEASGGNMGLAQNVAVKLVHESLAKRGFTSRNKIQMLSPEVLDQLRTSVQG